MMLITVGVFTFVAMVVMAYCQQAERDTRDD